MLISNKNKETKEKNKMNYSLLFIGFLFFIFAPFELYFANIEDLWFTIYHFASYLLIGFVIYIVLVICWEVFIAKHFMKIWDAIVCILFFLTFACYIQGNFFLVNYGQFDGQPIAWSKYRVAGFVSVGIFILALIVAVALIIKVDVKKRKRAINVISICLILVQLFTMSTLIITKDGFQNKEGYVVTTKNEWGYGKNKNFNILILDAFDSRVLNNLLNGEQSDDIKKIFKDFTYYRNTTDVFNHTDFSIPQIITGQKYLNEESYGEYLEHAYAKSPLLQELKRKNYEINIYSTVRLPQNETADQISNWKWAKLEVSSHKRLLKYIYKLVGFRYLPQPLKQSCWFYADDMDEIKEIKYTDNGGSITENDCIFNWSNLMFYKEIDQITKSDTENSFHLYHIKGLHVVRNLDANFNDAENVSIDETANGLFNLLNRYIKKLKEQGIYDNSIIVIMADHGFKEYDGDQFSQCPLLMVKRSNINHEFSQSEIPVSYADLQTGFINLLNNENMDNVFEIEDKPRERYIYISDWKGRPMMDNDYGENFFEYKIEGDAFDTQKIKKTGKAFLAK